ncbi:hypothetical protein HY008_03510 [Candidatus Woesebacteria bacterium]|nr:hypothetical protein [Candidatus Woesebacteria bacterium]
MSSDLSQGLIRTIYLTFAHNELVMAYVAGLAISGIMAFRRPNRFHLMLLVGFALLAFNFEYDKHIIESLREQTLTSIVADPSKHFRAQRFINVIISELVPVMLFVAGWGMIFLAIVSQGIGKKIQSSNFK